jgi:hypothetical protein
MPDFRTIFLKLCRRIKTCERSAEQGQFRSEGGQGLLTDLYELTMAAAYFENHIDASATFELFIRNLPPNRGDLLASGLEQGLESGISFSSLIRLNFTAGSRFCKTKAPFCGRDDV